MTSKQQQQQEVLPLDEALELLRFIVKDKEGNNSCAECTQRKPTCVAFLAPPNATVKGLHQRVGLGVFCCSKCAKYHERVGNTIKDLKNDREKWIRREIIALGDSGNAAVNRMYEATMDDRRQKEKIDGDEARKAFIKKKYRDLKFFDEPAYLEHLQQRIAGGLPPDGKATTSNTKNSSQETTQSSSKPTSKYNACSKDKPTNSGKSSRRKSPSSSRHTVTTTSLEDSDFDEDDNSSSGNTMPVRSLKPMQRRAYPAFNRHDHELSLTDLGYEECGGNGHHGSSADLSTMSWNSDGGGGEGGGGAEHSKRKKEKKRRSNRGSRNRGSLGSTTSGGGGESSNKPSSRQQDSTGRKLSKEPRKPEGSSRGDSSGSPMRRNVESSSEHSRARSRAFLGRAASRRSLGEDQDRSREPDNKGGRRGGGVERKGSRRSLGMEGGADSQARDTEGRRRGSRRSLGIDDTAAEGEKGRCGNLGRKGSRRSLGIENNDNDDTKGGAGERGRDRRDMIKRKGSRRSLGLETTTNNESDVIDKGSSRPAKSSGPPVTRGNRGSMGLGGPEDRRKAFMSSGRQNSMPVVRQSNNAKKPVSRKASLNMEQYEESGASASMVDRRKAFASGGRQSSMPDFGRPGPGRPETQCSFRGSRRPVQQQNPPPPVRSRRASVDHSPKRRSIRSPGPRRASVEHSPGRQPCGANLQSAMPPPPVRRTRGTSVEPRDYPDNRQSSRSPMPPPARRRRGASVEPRGCEEPRGPTGQGPQAGSLHMERRPPQPTRCISLKEERSDKPGLGNHKPSSAPSLAELGGGDDRRRREPSRRTNRRTLAESGESSTISGRPALSREPSRRNRNGSCSLMPEVPNEESQRRSRRETFVYGNAPEELANTPTQSSNSPRKCRSNPNLVNMVAS